MKKVLFNPKVWLSTMMLALVALGFMACDGDNDPQVAPTIATGAPTNVTSSTASVGGDITSNGGTIVLAAGICYSATSATPTIADDTTKTTVLTGKFVSRLKDLASGTKYYTRAYATNSIGTGYGEVMTITTGNEAPTVTDVVIDGEIKGDIEVTVTYQYNDKEGDAESGTTIQWYRANDATGAGKVAIEDATTDTYRISDEDQGKIIWVGVTPKAAIGTVVGVEVNSEKKGPVGEATTVTFTYNGSEVTYGIVNSTKTGRRWLDRNLGATDAPTAFRDNLNMGDLFQWGRPADGHQLLIRHAGNFDDPTPVNLTTSTLSITDAPAAPDNDKFILTSAAPFDWRSTPNNALWQGVNGINNPCPKGWRIPTIDEWTAEELVADRATNYEQMRLTGCGVRYTDGTFSGTSEAHYWSSTTAVFEGNNRTAMLRILSSDIPKVINETRGRGAACRCIKDELK